MKFSVKNVTYDNIKSHKKQGSHRNPRRYTFGKTTGGFKWTPEAIVSWNYMYYEAIVSWNYNTTY